MADNDMGLAELMALNNNGFAGNNMFLLLVLFFLRGGWGGWGGDAAAQGALTRAEMADGFNTAQIQDNQTTLMRDQFGLQADVLQNRYDAAINACNTQREIMQNRFDAQKCCCDMKEIALESRYTTQLGFQGIQAQLAQCCCDLKTAIHGEGEATRALIRDTNEQALRDQIQGLRDERAVLQNQLGIQAQTRSIISELLPQPKPMYPATSPYQAVPFQAIPYQMPTYAPACGGGCC